MEIDKHYDKLVELLRKEQACIKSIVQAGNQADAQLFVESVNEANKCIRKKEQVFKDIMTVREKYLAQAQERICKTLGIKPEVESPDQEKC